MHPTSVVLCMSNDGKPGHFGLFSSLIKVGVNVLFPELEIGKKKNLV